MFARQETPNATCSRNLLVGDMDAAQLARGVKQAGLDVPVVVLATTIAKSKIFVLAILSPTSNGSFFGEGTFASSSRS